MSATTSSTSSDSYNWHGYLLASAGLPAPKCAVDSDTLSRPDYTKIKSAEYLDSPEVLEVKANTLIKMWMAASRPLVYAGAGISTSSGIRDYASNAKGSAVQPQKRALTMDFIKSLKPTPAHRVITEMEKKGMVWGWLQQNHDGLAQKAGFPACKVNELHGAWLDKEANPIIKMSGSLRGDLYEWMLQMEDQCDFVFGVGTSFSGLNADRCATTCAKRHMSRAGQGLAILSIQQTQIDHMAALRIFCKIDEFMLIVARKLALTLDDKVYTYKPAALPVGPIDTKVWQAQSVLKEAWLNQLLAAKMKAEAEESKAPAAAKATTATTAAPALKKVEPAATQQQTTAPASKTVRRTSSVPPASRA